LGGGQPDLFNRCLKQADELLKAGEFYKAASYYETALTIRPDNPLAAIGAGLSYLAAGEAMTSSYYFRRGMALFPPLMEIRFDLDKMVGQAVVDDRIREFEDRVLVAGVQDPSVAFLLTFLYGSQGKDAEAKKWAATLSALKPEDKLMRAYADFVLTGVRPAEKEKTQAPPTR
jgi:tetratricopeptide (TPR) repeat protein